MGAGAEMTNAANFSNRDGVEPAGDWGVRKRPVVQADPCLRETGAWADQTSPAIVTYPAFELRRQWSRGSEILSGFSSPIPSHLV